MNVPDRAQLDRVITACLHCGLCLPVCPTYAMTLDERSSPRGRIRLIRSVLDGSLRPGREFAGEMNFCLDCRACEPACPAGVEYGTLVEHARAIVRREKLEPFMTRLKKRVILGGIFGSARRFSAFAAIMRFYRRSGLRDAVEKSGILALLPRSVRRAFLTMPDVADHPFSRSCPGMIPAEGERRGRVGLLTGCIMNVSFPEIHRETAGLLSRSGFDVVVPGGQFCCGSLHGHNGERTRAMRMAAELIGTFPPGLDAVVVNAAGCGAFMKEYPKLFDGEPGMAEKAGEFSRKVADISEFLAGRGMRQEAAAVTERITYHEACHLVHAQRISREPRELIVSVPGVEFVELPDAARCCGSAGIYNLLRPGDSDELLARKVASIASTGARIVVTANPGCHLQIERGLREAGLDVRVLHPVSLLCGTPRSSPH